MRPSGKVKRKLRLALTMSVDQGCVCFVVVVVVDDDDGPKEPGGGAAMVVCSVVVRLTLSELPQPASKTVLVKRAATAKIRT